MSKVANSFALLGDEEEEDVAILVQRFAKKVEVTASVPAAESEKQDSPNQSQQVSSERGKVRGGQGGGPGNAGFGRKEDQFSNEQHKKRNYIEESNGNGYDYANQRRGSGHGGSRGGGSNGRGHERGSDHENVIVDEKNVIVDVKNTIEDASAGWQEVKRTHVKKYVKEINTNWVEERPFRNVNRNYGGETRGYDGRNHGFRKSRDVTDYATVEQLNKSEVKENVSNEVKESVNIADANAVNVEFSNAISEGDAAPLTEEPKEVSAQQKTPEGSAKADKPAKRFEKEDEKLMTLEEYQKVLADRRKALETLKNEERKVDADKDFEAMEMRVKKKEEALLKPETSKLKKKDIIEKDEKKSRKTVSINEFLKPADGKMFVYRRPGSGLEQVGVSGDFRKAANPSDKGGFRNRVPTVQDGVSNVNRSEQGLRDRVPAAQVGVSNMNRSEQGSRNRVPTENRVNAKEGGLRNRVPTEQGESKNRVNVEQGGFRSKVYPQEGGATAILIEDQGQFPVLKSTAPAV